MPLGKILRLGGIDNRPPKTDQSIGGFRVARNVMPTPDMTLVPRNELEVYAGDPASIKSYEVITSYSNLPLALVSEGVTDVGLGISHARISLYLNNVRVPSGFRGSRFYNTAKSVNNHSVLTVRNKNTVYFLVPEQQLNVDNEFPSNFGLLKYDGVELTHAGCPQPLFKVAANLMGTTRFLRVVQHMIDFDNNEPVSEFVEFGMTTAVAPGTNANLPVLMTGSQAAPNNFVGNYANSTPKNRIPSLSISPYFIGTVAANDAIKTTITTSDTNITSQDIGTYLIVSHNTTDMVAKGILGGALGLALKIHSVSPLTISNTDGYVLNSNREWVKLGFNVAGINITYGSRKFLTFWESITSQGIYYFRSMAPCFPESASVATTIHATFTVVTTGAATATAGSDANIFTFGPTLNEWFDVVSRKLDPNAQEYPWGETYPYCMTSFQGLLLMASDDLIFTSDPTLGGVFEQFNQGSFIQIGSKEDGRITSIAGTEDFLLVCRERKNYYVVGNITTGSYRSQEIPGIEVGAWSNSSSISIKGTVIFIASSGIYQISSGGRVVKISELCPKNFSRYNTKGVNEDVSFILEGFQAGVKDVAIEGISMAFDNYRDILIIMKRGVNGNPSLIVHTKTGEVYEWDGIYEEVTGSKANCIAAIQASFYVGGIDKRELLGAAKLYKENNSSALRYTTNYPVKLFTSWLTGGEPSLEKEVLQLKIFGRIFPGTGGGLKIKQYNEWDRSTLITDARYTPISSVPLADQTQYSHKKRLNSSKALSSSIGIEITDDASFEIESLEVEFNSIQQGVKR